MKNRTAGAESIYNEVHLMVTRLEHFAYVESHYGNIKAKIVSQSALEAARAYEAIVEGRLERAHNTNTGDRT